MTFATLSRMTARYALGVLTATAFLWPASALAAEKGVHVDPNSPAGKEYAVPFDSARNQGHSPGAGVTGASGHGPGGGGSHSGSGGAHGQGAHHSGKSHGGGTSSARSHDSSPLFGQGITSGGNRANSAGAPSPAAIQAADRNGGSGWLWMTGIALAVLLLGGAVAVALPRIKRRHQQEAV